MRQVALTALLLSSVSTLALPSLAAAQTAPAAPPTSEVVVTGSRVIKNGNNSPTPLTVVSIDDALRLQPTTVADALNDLPIFSGSRGQLSNANNGITQSNGGGVSGGNFLNLRNMGAQRTLILFDGQRVSPTNVSGYVDVDMIPQMLLQRVDVVTGGTSAVYGSDAVSGVVNFVTDKAFNGLKFNAQYGITQRGYDPDADIGIAVGRELFGGRGHIEASAEYRDDAGIAYQSSRDPTHQVWSVQGSGTTADPYYLTPNARVNTSSFGGLINSGVLSGDSFDQNGVLSPFVHGTASGTAGIEIGGDGVYYNTSLKVPDRSGQFFGRFDYDFTDKIHGYVEATYTDKNTSEYTSWANLNNVTLSSTDPYLPATYQSQLATAGQSTFKFNKNLLDAPRQHPTNEEKQAFIDAELDGQFGPSYKWDVSYVHSNAELILINTNNINQGREYASLDAVVNPANGQTVCNITLTNPSSPYAQGCIPLNPFGPTSDNPAAVAWMREPTTYDAHTTMDDVAGSVSGSPVSTWAGPINIAVSGEWRNTSYNGLSNALPTSLLDCTGLRFNCVSTSTVWSSTIATRSTVSESVSEGAFETDIPLVKDIPFIQAFNLNGAVRYTAYSTVGDYWTWKVGGDWHVNDELTLRATRSRDIRAPTLDDLYAAQSASIGTYPDMLLNATDQNVLNVTVGNPNLTAEIGNTITGGAVYRPHWLPGFSVSADYFDIEVSNAILSLLAINATYQKVCYASGGTSPYCALQTRAINYTSTSAANVVTSSLNTVINIAEQDTSGVDLEANYATRVFDRAASVRLLSTYQPHIYYIQPGVPTLDQGGVAFGTNGVQAAPVWRLTAFFHYNPIDNFNIDLQTRWRTSLKLIPDPTQVFAGPPVPSATFTNMNLSYLIKGGWGQTEVFLNISNLFDASAPPAAYSGGQTIPGQQTNYIVGDDPLGRAFTIGFKLRH